MFRKKTYLFLIALVVLLSACGKEKIETKNMEQIYAEEGVPVKIQEIKKGNFKLLFNYNATLSGQVESSVYASIGERVEKVLVKVGDYVKKDQILASFPIDNPSAQYIQAKAAFDNASTSYERYSKLFETGGISQQTLDNIKTQLDVAKANFDVVSQLVYVKASMDGYITKVNVLPSDNVRKEQLLFTISDTRKLKAKLDIAENEISSIKKNTSVKAEWNGELINGRITEVDLAMNPYTKTFSAYAEFENSGKKILAGVTAKVTVEAGVKSNAIIVERKNLIREDNSFFVFIASENKAIKREIKLGSSKDLYVEIIDGLEPGELLIVEGQLNLDDQTKIKIIK